MCVRVCLHTYVCVLVYACVCACTSLPGRSLSAEFQQQNTTFEQLPKQVRDKVAVISLLAVFGVNWSLIRSCGLPFVKTHPVYASLVDYHAFNLVLFA